MIRTIVDNIGKIALVILVLVMAIAKAIFDVVIMNGGGMLPTIRQNEIIVINKFPMSEFKRGDILAYRGYVKGRFSLKRIVGLPGEKVHYDRFSGQLTINDRAVTRTKHPSSFDNKYIAQFKENHTGNIEVYALDFLASSPLFKPVQFNDLTNELTLEKGEYMGFSDNRMRTRTTSLEYGLARKNDVLGVVYPTGVVFDIEGLFKEDEAQTNTTATVYSDGKKPGNECKN